MANRGRRGAGASAKEPKAAAPAKEPKTPADKASGVNRALIGKGPLGFYVTVRVAGMPNVLLKARGLKSEQEAQAAVEALDTLPFDLKTEE